MDLKNVSLECYRRFSGPCNVRLNENLIALVGTNEAGKSSFLDALEELNTQEPIPEYDATRAEDCLPEISATFKLGDENRADLRRIEGGQDITGWTLTKSSDGELKVDFDANLQHDLGPRKNIQGDLSNLRESNILDDKARRSKQRDITQKLDELEKNLDTEKDFIGEEVINSIKSLQSSLQDIIENVDTESPEIETIVDACENLDELAEHEDQCPPYRARETLKLNRPNFISFTEGDRMLENRYELQKYNNNNFPDALENLAELADLDLSELLEAAENGDRSSVFSLRRKANEQLKTEFSKSWVQEDVVPVIDVDGTVLHLHTQTQNGERHSPIEDRSDGLRWFIALISFLNTKDAGEEPILLVDEAEQHLSYDAQASLIDILESQDIANTVIYTTHSAGCLPSDLGRGIRPIIQDEMEEKSDIKNGFWNDGEGFSPLMMAMGLSSFAFTVARNSLIGEGPCECILLPSLLREATGKDELKYQIAPGLSTADSDSMEALLSESGRTAFVVDSDEAGNDYRDSLLENGVNEEQILSYTEDASETVVLEDLVDPEVYTKAVNEEIEYWQSEKFDEIEANLSPENLPDSQRDNAVVDWCTEEGYDPVQKTTLAQRIAEKAGSGVDIVDPDRRETLIRIDQKAREFFGISQ